ncbi:protein IQ-DOMAIN 14-like [Dendrobium catenatum]|uniref:Protein IQ-DOMAIN 14 n=1 Tax=Dendrobium catenatum TaxID=906689 RepID=A0A2I0V876_9ASPA|nr:protein IQ-DOMAIN 14-like [Dendrobium catenatum]PKU59610.1 Protein IQ-DOMAIN 14 [Dendrobium catenatum]
MGRATRWLRNLFGGKKVNTAIEDTSARREKKRWNFKSPRDSYEAAQASVSWLRSFYAETEKEQNKQAIAVVAATAAAADAAVAAAQAAVAVVQLTSHSRSSKLGGFHEWLAAIKIQRVFRGYLAKKALRALKALVKLQAVVRGYLVRKQTAATFHSMQALIKAQETIRAQKCRALLSSERKFYQEKNPRTTLETSSFHRRKQSTSLYDVNCTSDGSPQVVQIDLFRPKSRSSGRTSYHPTDNNDEISPSSVSSLPKIGRISIPDCQLSFEKCRHSSTAHSTPRCIAPSTPTRSVCGMIDGGFHRPNYMNNTQCFEAKMRSQSTPKQRPDLMGSSNRLPLSELVIEQARASLSSIRMGKDEELSIKRVVVGRLDRSLLDLSRDRERDFHLQKK